MPALDRDRLLRRLFFFSGATSLAYEIVFQKLAGYVFGTTAWSTAAVLAAFMAGLAIGSFTGGRLADRVRRPLAWYAALELAIGIYALFVPGLFGVVEHTYVELYRRHALDLGALIAVRAFLAGAVTVVPAALMGATFPLVVRHARGVGADVTRLLSSLYAVNTFGATTGTAAATYLLMPYLGVWGTLGIAIVGNLTIFVYARRLARAVEPDQQAASIEAAVESPSSSAPIALLWLVAFVSGFVSFSYEVAWTHVLAVIVGTSVYAFGNMLCAFLLGVAIGSHFLERSRLARMSDRLLLLGGVHTLTGLSVATTTWLWDRLPETFRIAGYLAPGFLLSEITRFGVALMVMIVPTTLMGAAFPLLLDVARRRGQLGRSIGSIYSLNTTGAILGSVAAGFFLLEALGGQRTLEVAAAISVGLGILCLRFAQPHPARRRLIAVSLAAVLLGMVAAPRWSPFRLLHGQNVYFGAGRPFDKVLFLREDVHGGITSVTRRPEGVLELMTNGKFQGNDGTEMEAQLGFAHDPLLFVKKFDRALVIGLGTGTSLGVIAGYPFASIDVAEISPSIVEAAGRHFSHTNRGALSDPRVRVHHEDGRNFLLLHKTQYDAIQIELSNVWFAGAANLYSRDFYELCRARLGRHGILQQWIQLHHIELTDIMLMLNTMRQAFGHVMLFGSGVQAMAIASAEPIVADYYDLERLTAVLRPKGLLDHLPGKELAVQLGDLLLDERGVNDAIAGEIGRHLGPYLMPLFASTDLYPWLEYSTPKGARLRDARIGNTAALARYRGNRRPPIAGVPDVLTWDRLLGLIALRRQEDARALFHLNRVPAHMLDGLTPLISAAAQRLEPVP